MEDNVTFVRSVRDRVAKDAAVTEAEVRRIVELVQSTSGVASETDRKVQVLGVQFLANASVRQTEHSRDCWNAFYPQALLRAALSEEPSVLDPLCYSLWNYCKMGLVTLEEPCFSIISHLVAFYESDQSGGTSTSLSLLLGQILDLDVSRSLAIPKMYGTLGKVDVSCFPATAVNQVLESVFEQVKGEGPREALLALRNFAFCREAQPDILTEISSWVLQELTTGQTPLNRRVGYEADLVALLSNIVCQRPSIQDHILDSGVMEVVLDRIRLDDENPFIREWALLFVRNMCIENPRAQEFLRSMKLKDVVVDEVLKDSVEYDKLTGKFTAKRK